jgi:hypothetical protein
MEFESSSSESEDEAMDQSIKSTKSVVDYDNIHVRLKENEKPSLILYKYRWIVLVSFFFTSAAVGNVSGSLSTNRPIIMKIDETMSKEILDWAKYSDLIMYLPMNFASIWMIEY